MQSPKQLAQNRPAETATPIAMVIALLIAKALGTDDPYTVGYIAVVVAFVPAAVSWLVDMWRK